MVKTWNPEFIITTADNNYDNGAESTIDQNIGKYYHDFIYPYSSSYGNGSPDSNRFFPSLGNHDWNTPDAQPYPNYFALNSNGKSDNERYYTQVWGDIEFFIIDSDTHEPDGVTTGSTQYNWFINALDNSTAEWKIAVFHHPPFSSDASHGNATYMQWDFAGHGIQFVLSGHAHDYERIMRDGICYIVNGIGGKGLRNFIMPYVTGSEFRYNSKFGAQLISVVGPDLKLDFYNTDGTLLDCHTISSDPLPVELSVFDASIIDRQVRIHWVTQTEVNNYGFDIERSQDGENFQKIGFVEGHGNSNSPKEYSNMDEYPPAGKIYYRLKQIDNDGTIEYSNIIDVNFLLPSSIVLSKNYPNPFNPSTRIEYSVPTGGFVSLKDYDILGGEVDALVNEVKAAGNYSVEFKGSELSGGIYIYTLTSENQILFGKMNLLK